MPNFFLKNEGLVQNAEFSFWALKALIEAKIAAFVSF